MAETKTPNAVDTPDHDRVVMASRRPDGTPAQTEDFEFIGNKEFAVEAAKEQLKQQAVSAKDVELRGVGDETSEVVEDDTNKRLREAHEKVAGAAEKAAEAEVNKLHQGLGDNSPKK
jgi:hypothetical protein